MATVNYNDERFTQVEADRKAAIDASNQMYNNMIAGSDEFYQAQIDAANEYGETQKQNQQEQTDFTIEKIEQQKEQANKDYLKEQSGAYVDWQKQSDQYGSNAEQMAASGLAHTGYSESSQVAMYNAYQNRVATARESYNRAVLEYNNSIKEAQLQNNSLLAEIAFNTLQKTLELSLAGFQYKNTLLLQQAEAKRNLENDYYTRYQNVLAQINQENATAEQIRQFNASLALQREQFEWQKKNTRVSSGGGSGGGGGGTKAQTSDNRKTATRDNSHDKANALKKVNSGSIKTAQAARSLLKSLGITPSVSIIDGATWRKAKRLGDGGSEIQNFNTYAEYLKEYCIGAINGTF